MTNAPARRPVLLCVLDGFGLREEAPDNAASVAKMPVWRRLWQESPRAVLDACGKAVGLPEGQIGNSEVGHMNLGAGRVVYQDLPLIDRAIDSKELENKKELSAFVHALKKSGGTCHLMGLASPGGVHSHQRHIVALARLVAQAGVPVAIHAFLDGRDVPPDSAACQIEALEKDLAGISGARIVTVCGRYYAMDRDSRWERVEKAYDLLVFGKGERASAPLAAIRASYARGVQDEFVLPCVIEGYDGMRDGDGVLFANFRADRARQILRALLDPSFEAFARTKTISFAAAMGMVEYADFLNPFMTTLFPPKNIDNGLGQVIAAAGLTQLRIAETEKYPHVTFFFNGGREDPFPGESRIMVLSPKVATYDLQPEMSADEVTNKVVQAIASGAFDLIVLNYANPDMVGHTGKLDATVAALEALDGCLGRIVEAVDKAGGVMLVTADHGNCEVMRDPATGGPHTAHTLSKVPCVLVGERCALRGDGKLADVAPTILDLMGLAKPVDMDGESLLVRSKGTKKTRSVVKAAFFLSMVFFWPDCGVNSVWAQSAADLARLEKEMAARKVQAAQLDEAAKAQEAEIDELRKKAIEATRSFQESQEEQNKLEEKFAALEAESASRANALDVSRARLARITSELVRLARQPPAFLTMRKNAAPDYVRQNVLLREILPRLKAETDKLSGEMTYFDDLQSRVAEQKSLMVASGQNLQWQRHNLDQLVSARQGKLQKTKEEKEALQKQLEALAGEAKNLKQLLEKVTESSWSKTIGKSARDSLPALGSGLKHPVAGKLVRTFGQKDEFGVESEGVTYKPAQGAPIVAPQSGRVVFLGPFQGYGQVVIMQHQEGVHSFLAGFGRIEAEVGQNVAAGEPLGTMSTDAQKKPELYFEWRVDKKPVNPFLKGLAVKG